jgi:hypothetical protein
MFTSSWSSDVAFDAETDRADQAVVEVSLLWGDSTLAVKHVPLGKTLTLGDSDCDLLVSGADTIRVEHGASGVHVFPGATASVYCDGSSRDPAPFDLGIGHNAEILVGAFAVRLRVVAAGKETPLALADRLREGAFGGVGLSFAVHASVVAALAFFMPALANDDSEGIDRDRMYAMKAMLDAAAARELDRPETPVEETSPANEGSASGGGRAQGSEGASGRPDARSQGHMAIKKDPTAAELSLSRADALKMAEKFGMIELLGTIPVASASDAPAAPWATIANGLDDRNHRGNLWAQELGDAFGFGLGLQGTDEGGGGNNLGIGINDIGGLGRSLDARLGGGTCLAPPCDGMGRGTAPVRGSHTPHGPQMRVAKTEIDGGRIPAEVIQRIVRMSHGRFRNCYETGLRSNPSLGGRVAVRFVISREGAVSVASDAGSDLPDESVRKCVVQTFYSLSFPQPQGGTVRVTYPLTFSPAE